LESNFFQDQLELKGYWTSIIHKLIGENKSQPDNLILILDRISGVKNSHFGAKISGSFFSIIKSYFDLDPARDLTFSVEQKIFSICLKFFGQNLSNIFEEKGSTVNPVDFWLVLVGLSKQRDLPVVLR
jgi:hypothetical protein